MIIESVAFLFVLAAAAASAFFIGRAIERKALPVTDGDVALRALEALGAGIVIVDKTGACANAKALILLALDSGRDSRGAGPKAQPELAEALGARRELAPLLAAGSGQAELSFGEGVGLRRIEARAFSLDPANKLRGTVLVLSDVTKTAALLEELSALASQDALTGAFNRRHFGELGERDIELARRSGAEIGALMLDIDFFKRVNDEHGHAVGDELLKQVVSAAHGALRSSDVLCRYGGEEFAVLLPGTGRDESLVVAERLRSRIAAVSVPCPSGKVSVTVSLGAYSGRPKNGEDLALYLRRADEALYRSKALGRNRSSFWKPLGKEA